MNSFIVTDAVKEMNPLQAAFPAPVSPFHLTLPVPSQKGFWLFFFTSWPKVIYNLSMFNNWEDCLSDVTSVSIQPEISLPPLIRGQLLTRTEIEMTARSDCNRSLVELWWAAEHTQSRENKSLSSDIYSLGQHNNQALTLFWAWYKNNLEKKPAKWKKKPLPFPHQKLTSSPTNKR